MADANNSQVSVLEGQVRFSSSNAQMDLREGTTAKVEPARQSRFFLYQEIPTDPLDRWSEDRDKAQAKATSATHVSAHYGLADLDAAGKWMAVNELGIVWKPEVPPAWSPYQKGRWRYFETLGYTWISDDAWGWLPYHNGRWARLDNTGWVWQPGDSEVFHPAEVYWLRGADFAGWGPLAPGEPWTPPAGATPPLFYANGNTTFAAFQPDLRLIDPTGFPAPTPELLKTASFVAAPPSPAFLVSRLDAARPLLQMSGTRILPSIPGITMGEAPLPPAAVPNVPCYPRPVTVTRAAPPPDDVYPVPVTAVEVIEVPVVVNLPEHRDHFATSRQRHAEREHRSRRHQIDNHAGPRRPARRRGIHQRRCVVPLRRRLRRRPYARTRCAIRPRTARSPPCFRPNRRYTARSCRTSRRPRQTTRAPWRTCRRGRAGSR